MKKFIPLLAFVILSFFGCSGTDGLAADYPHAYTPDFSPLPGREGRPLEQWGTDNGETLISHTFSVFSDPIYPPEFTHFDYVNPEAPFGGTLRLAGQGTFDTFHVYGQRGDFHPFMRNFYDTLMSPSADEIDALYPLIAEKIEFAKDFSYVIFHINPLARYQDGVPILAEDVVFSFNKFMNEGVPQFASYYAEVREVRALDKYRVRFDLESPNREMIHSLGTLVVLPPHFWKERDFREPLFEPPLGSGSWKVSNYEMGQYILFEQMEDYWARDLPSSRGIGNFQFYRLDFYRDEAVLMEAFKSGSYDFRLENVARNWASQYTGPLFEQGYLVQAPFDHQVPPGTQAFVFNTSKEIFSDPRVRRALAFALDFEWMNTNLFFGQYERTTSFFQNTEYQAQGVPSEQELEILEPYRDRLPNQLFTQAYWVPQTDGSGSIRGQIEQALNLFQEAGWELKEGVLVKEDTSEPFEFELMIWSSSTERIALPLQENLKRMGVNMNISLVDTTQYINRLREGDYDFVSSGYPAFQYPNSDLLFYWQSEYLEFTYNTARVSDPIIDELVQGIIERVEDKEALIHWGRALDRVLLWNHFIIPQWHLSTYRIAHVDKFGKPAVWPLYGSGGSAYAYWWLDQDKASALPENLR